MTENTYFKAGDVVVCVDTWDSLNALTNGGIYKVSCVEANGLVCVFEGKKVDGWAAGRFRLATPEERAAFGASDAPQAAEPAPESVAPSPVAQPGPTRAELVRYYAGLFIAADGSRNGVAYVESAEAVVDALARRGYAPRCGKDEN